MILSILIKHKKLILIIIGVLMFGVMAYKLYGRAKIAQVPVPDDDVNNTVTDNEREKANEIARALYDNMDGVSSIWWRSMQVFKDYAKQSDKVFVLIYNRFNELYGMANKGTLREWIKSDAFSSNDWKFIEEIIFPRMDRLNLT
jgi:hypothetical protein